MLSHTYTQKPRYNSVEHEEKHNAEKIALCLLLTFGLALIAILCNFFFEFLNTYKEELNTAIFYVAMLVIIAIGSCLVFTAFYYCSMLWLNFSIKRSKTAHIKEKLRAETINNRLADATQRQMDQGLVYLAEQETEHGKVKFKNLPSRRSQPIPPDYKYFPKENEPNKADKAEIKNNLLPNIKQQRLLIVGGQGTGKTTLLKHIAAERNKTSLILILDSHNTPDKWCSYYRIVGHGRDYKAIKEELTKLVQVMDYRYKELASGKVKEGAHEIITVISDEWTTLSKNVTNLDELLIPLLTESRKVGINFILATHSETAQSLGIKGAYDLKNNFDAILRLKNINGERLVDVDHGNNITTYYHPGNFKEKIYKSKGEINSILDKDSIEENKIIETYYKLKEMNCFSLNKLSLEIYGKKGGHYTKQLKEVLKQNNIEL